MKKLQYGDKCKQGHVLTPDTVQIIQNRGLRCKICQREAVEKYQAKNKEKILQRLKRKWLLDDTLKVQNRKRKREEYKRNPEKLKERRKMWRLNNLDKVREWHSAPERKIHSNISRAIRQAMKQRKKIQRHRRQQYRRQPISKLRDKNVHRTVEEKIQESTKTLDDNGIGA